MATKPTAKKAAKKPSTEVAPAATNTALSVTQRLAAISARGRQQIAKAPSGTGNTISFKNGAITVGGVKIGNEMKVIALHPQYVRTYYDSIYQPDKIVPPACYSYDGEKPHEKAANKQSSSCEACPMNEWGTDQRGRGKACKEGLRVAFLSAQGNVNAEVMGRAPILQANFSVLNSKDVAPVIDAMYDHYGHPGKAVCVLTAEPDEARQVINTLSVDYEIDNEDILNAIIGRIEEAEKMLTVPFPEPEEGSRPAGRKRPAARKQRSF